MAGRKTATESRTSTKESLAAIRARAAEKVEKDGKRSDSVGAALQRALKESA
jgi:hypothetical protein